MTKQFSRNYYLTPAISSWKHFKSSFPSSNSKLPALARFHFATLLVHYREGVSRQQFQPAI
jgi:hypothetical protein